MTFTTAKAEWIEAAKTFRIPYWDWAKQPDVLKCTLPDSMGGWSEETCSWNNPTVKVTKPDGKQESIANPLLSYKFDTDKMAPNDRRNEPVRLS